MPRRRRTPSRVCPQPGCPRLLGPRERCPDHTPAPFDTSTYRTRRAIPEALRRRILERDNRTCQVCGQPATDVDHVVPRAGGGTDTPSNLIALCTPCHRRKTSQQANATRWGTRQA
jgi:5-methylcytosine-specific restriction enzyme A